MFVLLNSMAHCEKRDIGAHRTVDVASFGEGRNRGAEAALTRTHTLNSADNRELIRLIVHLPSLVSGYLAFGVKVKVESDLISIFNSKVCVLCVCVVTILYEVVLWWGKQLAL